MDRKEKKGNPFEAPMKRIEPPKELPAAPDISTIIEEPKEEEKPKAEVRNCPQEYLDLRCPCGQTYENCRGAIIETPIGVMVLTRDQTFEILSEKARR